MNPQEVLERGRFLGEEFLLWLWQRGLAEGGESGLPEDRSCCFVDDAVQLVNERGDVKELSLRKGNPAESREAFEALSRGMRPSRAKLRILSGDMEWSFTLHAESLLVAGMKLPPTASKDPAGRAADRLFLLEEGLGHLERRFKAFLETRTAQAAPLEEALRAWVRAGLEDGAGEAPWEE
ncbi:MAG: hypothetical protein HY823_15415 [Acidobacteria bacterium]|nr:hypothetical protein [Acidobacteriota bacterium]